MYRYYDVIVSLFIEVLLNYDRVSARSKEGAGIFGVTKAFYLSTESQNSTGDLHGHMLIWIDGMTTTTAEYYELLQSASLRLRVEQYVSSIASSCYSVMPTKCPACSCGGLASLPFDKRAFEKPVRGGNPCLTAHCLSCGVMFGGTQLVEMEIKREESRISAPLGDVTDDDVHYRIAMPQPLELLPQPGTQAAVIVSKALLNYQTHRCTHAKSCFKPSKRTPKGNVCRMFFPKQTVSATECAENGSLLIARPVGCEYLNTYSPIINSVLKMNHDIKFLSAGEGKSV